MANLKLGKHGRTHTKMMHKTHKRGAVSEYQAATWFSEQGWEVYWSNLGQSAVDFIISRENDVHTIQVKPAIKVPADGETQYLKVNLTHGSGKGQLYRDNTFHILAACSEDGRIWVIPFDCLPTDLKQFSVWIYNKKTGYEKWLVKPPQ